MKRWTVALMIVVAMATGVLAEGWTVGVLTDVETSMLEARIGVQVDEVWEVGAMGVWYAEDPGTDWGAGGYTKLAVDPNGSIPIANWLPGIGDLLNLPDSLTAETYIIGKLVCIPYDDGPDLVGSVGAGAQIGPAVIEWVYSIVEGGESDDPILSSGATLWAGLCLEF